MRSDPRSERGVALIITLMATSLMLALGAALILTTTIETRIVGNQRQAAEAFYAADAAIELAVNELAPLPDWSAVLSGTVTSSFTDGGPSGVRRLPGGAAFDLTEATGSVRCGRPACSAADLVVITEDRPWGRNNPVWQPFAYGPIDRLLPAGGVVSMMYVVVWVADDPSENDDDPLRDGGPPVGCDPAADPPCVDRNGGRDAVVLMSRAIGPGGTQRTIAATVARRDTTRVLSWREVR